VVVAIITAKRNIKYRYMANLPAGSASIRISELTGSSRSAG
jgi:hypothetical protein